MIAHVTIGARHLILADPEAGSAACRVLEDSIDCPDCGADLWTGASVVGPRRRDARSGMRLRCVCGRAWAIRRGDPLEAETCR